MNTRKPKVVIKSKIVNTALSIIEDNIAFLTSQQLDKLIFLAETNLYEKSNNKNNYGRRQKNKTKEPKTN